MSQPYETDDEFNWTGRDYFEVDLPTLLMMPVPATQAIDPITPPPPPAPAPAPLKIEEIDDPDATRMYTPGPIPRKP